MQRPEVVVLPPGRQQQQKHGERQQSEWPEGPKPGGDEQGDQSDEPERAAGPERGRDGRELVTFSWELHHLYVLDGVRANHLLQRARLDLQWPLSRTIGVGSSGEFFHRQTFYHDSAERARYEFPQFRVFLTWTP